MLKGGLIPELPAILQPSPRAMIIIHLRLGIAHAHLPGFLLEHINRHGLLRSLITIACLDDLYILAGYGSQTSEQGITRGKHVPKKLDFRAADSPNSDFNNKLAAISRWRNIVHLKPRHDKHKIIPVLGPPSSDFHHAQEFASRMPMNLE